MEIFIWVNFVILAYIVLRTEVLMVDFSKLTTAVDALTVEVDVAIAKIGTPPVEDPKVQVAVDAAAAAVQAETDKLAAAAPPPATP